MPQTLLPIELCELIIDFVDDEATLQSTSLVCKAWIARSQFNLFRVVELCLPTHLDRFRELLLAAPHLAGLVKEIFISENSLLGLLRPSMSVVARFPSLISPHPCIQPHRLTVHKQLWLPTRYNPLYLAELSRLTSITSLDLFDVTFTTVADLSIVLRALRHLRSLSAEDLDDQRQLDPETSASIGSDLPSLTTLRIRSSHPTSVTDWLLRHNRFPAIRYMECNYQLSATLGANQGLGAFWRASGATLETLTLAISKRTLGTSLLPSVIGASRPEQHPATTPLTSALPHHRRTPQPFLLYLPHHATSRLPART